MITRETRWIATSAEIARGDTFARLEAASAAERRRGRAEKVRAMKGASTRRWTMLDERGRDDDEVGGGGAMAARGDDGGWREADRQLRRGRIRAHVGAAPQRVLVP